MTPLTLATLILSSISKPPTYSTDNYLAIPSLYLRILLILTPPSQTTNFIPITTTYLHYQIYSQIAHFPIPSILFTSILSPRAIAIIIRHHTQSPPPTATTRKLSILPRQDQIPHSTGQIPIKVDRTVILQYPRVPKPPPLLQREYNNRDSRPPPIIPTPISLSRTG